MLTGLSQLAQQVAAATGADELAAILVAGTAALLGADACQLLRLDADGETLDAAGLDPGRAGRPARTRPPS